MNRTEEILNLLKDHKRRINHLEHLEPAVAVVFDRAIVINESGNDADFRVEAVGQPNALFVQGSDGNIGMGTATPKGMSLQLGNGISALTFNDYMDVHGSFTIMHNAYNEGRTPTYKWIESHASFGCRGIEFDYNEGILFYADSVASTANAAFTPTLRMIIKHDGKVGIGLTPTANMAGLSIEAGLLTLKERATPTADANYGKLYTKNDNLLYFQDGAGVERPLAYMA